MAGNKKTIVMKQYLVTLWPEVFSKPKKIKKSKQREIVIDIDITIEYEQDYDYFYCPYHDVIFVY